MSETPEKESPRDSRPEHGEDGQCSVNHSGGEDETHDGQLLMTAFASSAGTPAVASASATAMAAGTVESAPDDVDSSTPGKNPASSGPDGQPPRKRQRVRLSCLECRRRKLSCDRAFPCERCIKSGNPDRCSYDSKHGPPGTVKAGIPQATFAHAYGSRRSVSIHSPGAVGPALDTLPRGADLALSKSGATEDRIGRLEMELAQMKAMLGKVVPNGNSVSLHSPEEAPIRPEIKDPAKDQPLPREMVLNLLEPGNNQVEELRFFRGKEFRTRYFGPHNACMAFSEVSLGTAFFFFFSFNFPL